MTYHLLKIAIFRIKRSMNRLCGNILINQMLPYTKENKLVVWYYITLTISSTNPNAYVTLLTIKSQDTEVAKTKCGITLKSI